MCIRDSTTADPSILFDSKTATDTDFWLGVQEDAGGDDDDAVSYTHLRAHETVLDLVCRLLLEKKNTTVRQSI